MLEGRLEEVAGQVGSTSAAFDDGSTGGHGPCRAGSARVELGLGVWVLGRVRGRWTECPWSGECFAEVVDLGGGA